MANNRLNVANQLFSKKLTLLVGLDNQLSWHLNYQRDVSEVDEEFVNFVVHVLTHSSECYFLKKCEFDPFSIIEHKNYFFDIFLFIIKKFSSFNVRNEL